MPQTRRQNKNATAGKEGEVRQAADISKRAWVLVAFCGLVLLGQGAAADTITVGAIKFGTVNWELDVIKHHGLDKAEGSEIELLPLANKSATAVALQAGEADVIVTDWIWVARQRAEGRAFSFAPYSTALGALMVPADSPIDGLDSLRGKSLGIAGGPLDKSWLLLQGLAAEAHGFDADKEVDKVFAAAPLLNEQILAGRVDAVLNYWHYAARLEAAGLRRVMGVEEIARKLGIETAVPLVGYVFDEDWAAANTEDLQAFLRATRKAKAILAESDAEWERLRPLMKVTDEATFEALRDHYRAGIPKSWGEAERTDAARLFALLAERGGKKLVGSATEVPEGTFWPGFTF